MKWFLSLFLVILCATIIGLSLQKKDQLERPMTQIQEALGYPGLLYQKPLNDFVFVYPDTQVFVVMSTVPGMKPWKA